MQRRESAIDGRRGSSLALLMAHPSCAEILLYNLCQIKGTLASLLPPGAKLGEIGADRALGRW